MTIEPLTAENAVKLSEPTLGQVLLATDDASEIADLLRLATYHASQSPVILSLYQDRVAEARQRFRTMARRLGYELVPAKREPA